MRLLGMQITRSKTDKALAPVADNRGGGWLRILESFPGAWQRNVAIDQNLVLSYHAVYACMTLIASDIAKLRVKLVAQDNDGIWTEVTNPAFSPVLRRPNPYQNRIQFWENWILSKLMRGNTYVLKDRDQRGIVVRLYILDPTRCQPMVSDDGSVFYQLQADNLSAIDGSIMVPAREIIHDRMNCLFHPLVGVSPIFANGLAATQGLNIQNSSARLFRNNSTPGGILTAPGTINEPTAARLKTDWESNFTGENVGRVAVMGDGLKYERLAMTAEEGQLMDQLKWTAETVCSTFHVPPYKIGVGQMPTNNNVQTLNIEYYSQCLQALIEAAEECLDEGLGLGWGVGLGTEFDVDNLLRMDTLTQMLVLKEAVGSAIMAPDEARRKVDLKPVPGGASPYLQEQNFSLAALAKRDALDDPWASRTGATAQPALLAPPEDGEDDDAGNAQRDYAADILRAARRYEFAAA